MYIIFSVNKTFRDRSDSMAETELVQSCLNNIKVNM